MRRPAELVEQNSARRYTARWHRVATWAAGVLPGDLEIRDRPGQVRISTRRGVWVTDLHDDEEAESRAADLAALEIDLGPRGNGPGSGGRRRVLVRVFTWVVDVHAGGVMYDPQWITTGEGFTARAAAASHNRYVRAYALAVEAGIESRRLAATAMEVVWWTAAQARAYV